MLLEAGQVGFGPLNATRVYASPAVNVHGEQLARAFLS
jgi:hypothetical protein